MKEIPLTQGKVALVDDGVYEWASKFKWYAARHGNKFYAARSAYVGNGKQRTTFLHREVMKPSAGEKIDHKFGNTLDNRESELRRATPAQNSQGFKSKKSNTRSQFIGVNWDKAVGKWRAKIMKDRRRHHLGYFHNEENAARAYDTAARGLFGEFAKLNFP